MLARRLRRRPNIKSALIYRLVFAGMRVLILTGEMVPERSQTHLGSVPRGSPVHG